MLLRADEEGLEDVFSGMRACLNRGQIRLAMEGPVSMPCQVRSGRNGRGVMGKEEMLRVDG